MLMVYLLYYVWFQRLWICTFFPLFRNSRAQYDKFEKCFACMITVWVLCGDRGLALYVTLCPINAQKNKKSCCQVLICLQYCSWCFTDNCSLITIDYLWILVYLMWPDVNQFLIVSADVYLVQNQTGTVQNGTNFREIYNLLRDLLSCLMLYYPVNSVPICLERQANSTSYY